MKRKIGVCILFVCGIVMTFCCGTFHVDAIDVKEENVRTADRNIIRDMQAEFIDEEVEETTPCNPYFFKEDRVVLTTRAKYFIDPFVEENIHLNMYKVHVYEHGTVYKLEIEHVGFFDDARWNIYFYVMEDKIYRLCSWIYQDGQVISFYDDDELLVNVLDTDEKLIENGVIVCQMEDITVDEADGEGRYRYSISREDDLITYYRSDVQPNGERGFYEWFIWKEGEGLIEYGSGYKAGADTLYLYDIAIDTEKAFFDDDYKDRRAKRADIFIHGYDDTKQDQENEIQNSFFYYTNETKVTYEGYIWPLSYSREIWTDVCLNITEMERFDDGILYTLELDQIDVEDPWDGITWGRRYLGYFYVTDDAIYRWASTMDGFTEERNQEILQWLREGEEELFEPRYIVCCENGTEDIVDELGYHSFVEVDGDRRIYRYYNNYYYGTKAYQLMVWEKGKGLVYYIFGEGSMRMHIEFGLDLVKERQTEYGYRYDMFHQNEQVGIEGL